MKAFVFSFLILLITYTAHANDTVVNYYISDKSSVPLQLIDNGKQAGIVTDVINQLNVDGTDIQQTVLPFKRMIMNMASDDNIWISYGSAAWPGPQSTSLSQTPIISVQHVLLMTPSTHYQTIEDLFGKTIVIIRGFDYPGLDAYFRNGIIKSHEVKTHKQAIESVLRGRADAFPEMKFRLNYHLNKHKIATKDYKLKLISNVIPDYDINLCFSKNFPTRIRNKIEQRLYEMKYQGELEKIITNYVN